MAKPTAGKAQATGDVTERTARTTIRRFGLALAILAVHVDELPLDPVGLLKRVSRLVGPTMNLQDAVTTLFAVPDNVWPADHLGLGDSAVEAVTKLARIARAVIDWYSAKKQEEFFAGTPLSALLDMAFRGWSHEPWVQTVFVELQVLELTGDRAVATEARQILKVFYRRAYRHGRGNVPHAEEPRRSLPNRAGRLLTSRARALQEEIEQLIREKVSVKNAVEGVKGRVKKDKQFRDPAYESKVLAKLDERLAEARIWPESDALKIAVANAAVRKSSPK